MTTPNPLQNLKITIVGSMENVDKDKWNSMATADIYSPFLEYEFLSSVETSGCASPETGWYPRHFLINHEDQIIGAAPAWGKTHSMGEFVFDQELAHIANDLNKAYYPKLVATLPFTPSPGYQFLCDLKAGKSFIHNLILSAMKNHTQQSQMQSHSILFAAPQWAFSDQLSDHNKTNYLEWTHQYYLWENKSYRQFDDYLNCFNKNQRRNIKRERASIPDQNITIKALTGSDLTEDIMSQMYGFYKNTNETFGLWAAFFLNRQWFVEIGQTWGHRILVFAAYTDPKSPPVAMSMLVQKAKNLIGRYWGANQYIHNLHFELCYYAPIQYAIENGFQTFDPGMGSFHKARRGFQSREYSTWHCFEDAQIQELFSSVLPQINRSERHMIEKLDRAVPWKKTP